MAVTGRSAAKFRPGAGGGLLTDKERREYSEQGYAVVDRPIVPEQYLELIEESIRRRTSEENHDRLQLGVSLRPVIEHCRAVAAELLEVRRPSCHFDHAIVKASGTGTAIAWHQDQASSRTRAFGRSVHCWIPLVDVDGTNGCLRYIPFEGSPRLVPHRYLGSEGKFEALEVDESKAVDAHLRRGGMAIHDPLTLHCSTDNISGSDRGAWVVQYGAGFAPSVRERILRLRRLTAPRRRSGDPRDVPGLPSTG